MATQDEEARMRALSLSIEILANSIYGQKMGFFLVVSPFDVDHPKADYIGNVELALAIEWLRETANNLESEL